MGNMEEHYSFLGLVDRSQSEEIGMGFVQMVLTIFDREFCVHCKDSVSESEMILVIASRSPILDYLDRWKMLQRLGY